MALREHIREKALVCIDEVYPESGAANASFFPVECFLDEAARSVIKRVPQRVLGAGTELSPATLQPNADGSGCMTLPEDFVRLLRFRIKGWQRPVLVPVYDTDPRYAQQFNPVLRGGESKPVVVLCENSRSLEYYSSSHGTSAVLQEGRYYGFTTVDDSYPRHLIDITAWKTAELVLATMNDITPMQLCTARINEILQTL